MSDDRTSQPASYDVSFVDVANPVVHIDGLQLGLRGTEDSAELLANEGLWRQVSRIRHAAARLVLPEEEITLTNPFAAVVLPARHPYRTIGGDHVTPGGNKEGGGDDDCNENGNDDGTTAASNPHNDPPHQTSAVRAVVFFCGSPHKSYPGTASNATAAAAMIEGTVVHDMAVTTSARPTAGDGRAPDGTMGRDGHGGGGGGTGSGVVTIFHPSGRLQVEVEVDGDGCGRHDEGGRQPSLRRSVIGRTARRIIVYLKPHTVDRLGR